MVRRSRPFGIPLFALCLLPACFSPEDAQDTDGTQTAEGTADSGGTMASATADGTTTAGTSNGTTAGSNSTGVTSDTTATTATTGSGDGVAPSIVAVTPSDGALGVLADVQIVVEFSEPMDKPSTETAFDSADILPDEATFSWNGVADTLTVTPGTSLAYAEGNDDSVTALTYAFSMSTDAQDVSGMNLDAPLDVSFSTARHITMTIPPVGPDSGYVVSQDPPFLATNNNFSVGDGPGNEWFRSLLSFDITGLPATVVVWSSATLQLDQMEYDDIYGTPYASLMELRIHDESYTDFGFDAAQSVGPDLGEFATDLVAEQKTADVTTAVEADHGQDVTQFMLKFQLDTNNDQDLDVARFSQTDAALVVDVLAE